MRGKRFTFLCSLDERELLAELARRLHRSQGDVVRLLIREAAIRLINRDTAINHDKDKSHTEVNLLG